LFEFFLMTGCREQEVIYMTDRCLDFSNCTVSVKHNPEYGWTPKAYKERCIPVPKALMSKLKAMLVKRGKGGLLFPTKNGQPKLNFLDMAKAVAKRAGIDESEVWLHRFRATFATRSLAQQVLMSIISAQLRFPVLKWSSLSENDHLRAGQIVAAFELSLTRIGAVSKAHL
jgi:integrase